nr:hypothetical protein [Salinigranum rubrum]
MFNGLANVVLSRMSAEGVVLADAQDLRIAEVVPNSDGVVGRT